MSRDVDVVLLSLGTTRGLRIADAELVAMTREAGATVVAIGTRIGLTDRLRRGYPVNDLVEAIAARRALDSALRRLCPRAVIFSSTTAAMLAPARGLPFAVWTDSPARLNRPGARNAVLHRLERRSLHRARLVLTQSAPAVAALPAGSAPAEVISPPITQAPPPAGPREPLVVAYVPDPKAKGLALLCATWARTNSPGAQLVVTGIPGERARRFLDRQGLAVPPSLEIVGMLEQAVFQELLSRARVFLSAARWEDFGMAPLEALDRGAALVGASAGGPYPALAIAGELAPHFVAVDRSPDSLARALEAALRTDERALAAYRHAARAQLAPYRREALVTRLRERVLPVLLDRRG